MSPFSSTLKNIAQNSLSTTFWIASAADRMANNIIAASRYSGELEHQIGAIAGLAIHKASHLLQTAYKRYPGKTCGAMALPGSIALAAQGANSGDGYIFAAGVTSALLNLFLLRRAETPAPHMTEEQNYKDPQDSRRFCYLLTDPKKYPHEFCALMETGISIPLIIGGLNAAGGPQQGFGIMGMAELAAIALIVLVRERNALIPVIQQGGRTFPLVDFVTKRPLAAAAILYQTGDTAPLVQGLINGNLTGETITTVASFTLCNLFLFNARKRQPIDLETQQCNAENGDGYSVVPDIAELSRSA